MAVEPDLQEWFPPRAGDTLDACVGGGVWRTVGGTMRMSAWLILVAVLVGTTGCSMFGRKRAMTTVETLEAAGFQTRTATTPTRVAMMRSLPANRLVPVRAGERLGYVYADPGTSTFLVGSPRDYEKYWTLQADGEGVAAAANEAAVVNAWGVGDAWDWEEFAPLWW